MRYTLKREGQALATSDSSMDLINTYWDVIRADWKCGFVLEDSAPNMRCSLWACVWTDAFNGVELSPMVL